MSNRFNLPIALLVATLSPLSLADNSTHTGEGTLYGYGGGGNCSFPKPSNILTAAMNKADYNDSAACGSLIVVTNEDTGLSVTVRIDDQCPECAKGDVDMDIKAFTQIAELSKGRIPISWHYVANDQAGNMKLYFKEGSSRWWTAVQVRDHLYPIRKLGYRATGSGSNFIDLPRKPYNYFLAESGFGDGPYDFLITDFWGQTVEVSGIEFAETKEIDTGMQFPVYGGGNNHESDSSDNANDNSSADDGNSNNIVVRARGRSGEENITLRVNNEQVASWNLSSNMQNYSASTNLSGNATVTFTNDSNGRDVQVDYLQVNGQTRQAEDQSDNTGAYANGSCGGGHHTEWLHCNGAIGFGDI
jgi:expansin (peptidoglycan-binding protein)